MPDALTDPLMEENADEIRINELPQLPRRKDAYWLQPWIGIVGGTTFQAVIYHYSSMRVANAPLNMMGPKFLVDFIAPVTNGAIALCWLCLAHIFFFNGGAVVHRSQKTCYPIPEEVKKRLRVGQSLDGLKNIENEKLGTYCIRCLVWRPPKAHHKDMSNHHCSVCARCVTGFDHHCGLLGRCIVIDNLASFYTVLTLICLGFLDMLFSFYSTLDTDSPDAGLISTVTWVVMLIFSFCSCCVLSCSTGFRILENRSRTEQMKRPREVRGAEAYR